jgi:ATP-dependent DNA helicase DinG
MWGGFMRGHAPQLGDVTKIQTNKSANRSRFSLRLAVGIRGRARAPIAPAPIPGIEPPAAWEVCHLDFIDENDLHASEIVYEPPANTPGRFLANGAFLFAAYGCALTERQTTSGMYVYTAASLTTGKSETLSRRKRQLDKDGFPGMAAKIGALPFRGDGRLSIDRKPGAGANGKTLTGTAKRIFIDILPLYGYAVRENQIKLAEHILDVAGRRGITLAESEVGTGKTHAYLTAAALVKRGRLNDFWLQGCYPSQSCVESVNMPVVVSTSSIALQKAIDTDYIPELSRILLRHGVINTPLTSAVRKGKDHYICEKRLRIFYESTDAKTKAALAAFMGAAAPFDLTGVESLSPHMKRHIRVSGKCPENCGHRAECRYQGYLKKANSLKVDFQITNHNYFLADILHRAGGKRPLLPNCQFVIIDEAHKFLAAARSMYGMELTDSELPELAREIHTFTLGKSNSGVNVHRFAKRMEEQSGKLFQRLNDNIPETDGDDDAERFTAVMDGDVCRCLKKLAGISDDLAEAVADSRIQMLYRDRRSKAVWLLGMVYDRVNELRQQSRLVHWLEKRVEGEIETDVLRAIPKDLDERLHRDLWGGGIPIVLTSGTLSASGDFTRAKRTLGLDRLPERRLFSTTMPSPFDYKNNCLIYISEATPFPDNKDKQYIDAIADEIERLVIASHGHAAVLFTSYNAMGQVHAILNRRGLPFPLFRLERGGVNAIDRFKRSGNGILLASGAMWEGIDIPGDALSLLVIVKLPFAVPDPIGDYERSLCGGMEKYKALCVVPDMLVKNKQGFGRLLRIESDTGVFAMLDSRVNERGTFRSRFLASLPPCAVTSRISVVSQFIRDKKPRAYFEQGR